MLLLTQFICFLFSPEYIIFIFISFTLIYGTGVSLDTRVAVGVGTGVIRYGLVGLSKFFEISDFGILYETSSYLNYCCNSIFTYIYVYLLNRF